MTSSLADCLGFQCGKSVLLIMIRIKIDNLRFIPSSDHDKRCRTASKLSRLYRYHTRSTLDSAPIVRKFFGSFPKELWSRKSFLHNSISTLHINLISLSYQSSLYETLSNFGTRSELIRRWA